MNEELEIENFDPSKNPRGAAEVKRLLRACDLGVETDIQLFVVARSKGKIIACAGLADDVVKCVAIAAEFRGTSLAPKLLNEIQQLAVERGQSHLFLYTKPGNAQLFAGCGFHMIVEVPGNACLMENTPVGIRDYCDSLQEFRQPGKRIGCVVLNANPFTLGHLHLVCRALWDCDWLHVFVVAEDASAIRYTDRLRMVRAALDGMERVTVHAGSRYLISKATFPGYFIKDHCVVEACSTAIDLLIFRRFIAPALGITHRFIGSEPYCRLTRKYNEDIFGWLESETEQGAPVHVLEIPRLEVSGRAVSASRVRRLLAKGNFAAIAPLVPATTLACLRDKYDVFAELHTSRPATDLIEVH
jgi:[citrate (pro-3S)-lyase] ligase